MNIIDQSLQLLAKENKDAYNNFMRIYKELECESLKKQVEEKEAEIKKQSEELTELRRK